MKTVNLIKKIINWLKRLFNKLFGKKKITKKIKNNIHNAKNKRYLKGYGVFVEDAYSESFPLYLYLNKEEKKKIVEKINQIKEELLNVNNELEKKEISDLNNLITKIEKNDISVYQGQRIHEKLETLPKIGDMNKTLISKNISQMVNEITEIIHNFDANIQEKVKKEYNKVNYITLTTLLIDETNEELRNLEDNYKKHRYNKSYYDRELKKIKDRIKNLRKIRDSKSVCDEILALRKELYTKSKDKYDLLYNEEIFLNIEKECDDMLKKVNKRIVDLKKITNKEKQEEKIPEKIEDEKEKQRQEEMLENILKRFQDMKLAEEILLLNNQNEVKITSIKDLVDFMDQSYYDFINGEKAIFHFEKNKTRTELAKLYNDLEFINGHLNEREIMMIEHINYSLDDLLEKTIAKKKEVESSLKEKYNYQEDKHESAILVDNKLMLQTEKEQIQEGRQLVFTKKRDTTNY